jgi:holo-[acyl-carrier protein] synthase
MHTLLNLGCDLVEIGRIERLGQRNRDAFFSRVLGDQERVFFGARCNWRICARHVAAKEAMFKALGTGLSATMRWSDVQVVYAKGRSQLHVSGSALGRFEELGGREMFLTLSDDTKHALAVVMLTGEPRESAMACVDANG